MASRLIPLRDDMLALAVRYALGRRTYVVNEVVDEVLRAWADLSPGVRACIVRDVRDADDYGHDCDRVEWMRLLAAVDEPGPRAQNRGAE